MTARLNPYLTFRGTARAVLERYQEIFGGELTISTFDAFGVSDDPAEQGHVMHGQLLAPNGLVLMAADVPASMESGGNGTVSLSGDADSAADLRAWWAALVDGGTVVEPLVTAPWGDEFGMLTDRFGVAWLVNIAGPAA
ncbi:MAG TPA: VOC family protein [Cellulomonas sp.]